MKPEDLTAEKFPDLTIVQAGNLSASDTILYFTVFTDENHQLIILGTSDGYSRMSNEEWIRLMLGPLGQVKHHLISQSGASSFVETQRLVKAAIRPESPHFVIGPKQ